MKPILLLAALAALALPVSASAGSGWIQTAYADRINNAYDFFDSANWDEGDVNGLFGSGLGTGKTTQFIKFGQDWTNAFSFAHSNEANLTFVGDGTRNATWFVPGDAVFASPATKGAITFGNETDGRKFFLDLGGAKRRFALGGTGGYAFANAVTNGDLEIESTAPAVSLKYSGAMVAGDLDFFGTKLQFDSSKNGEAGAARARNLVFRGQEFEVKGNGTVHAEDCIDGDFVVDGSRGALKLLSVVTGTAGASFTADALSITNGALLGIRGAGLGGTPGTGVANVFFGTAPATVGGAGGTECPVIPSVIASSTYGNNSILGYAYDSSLATYAATTGVRPLDFSTEFVSSAGNVVSGRENLLVVHGSAVEVDGDVTVNAVVLQGGAGSDTSTLSGTEGSVLRVTSGQVLVGYHLKTTPVISVPVDFGSARGCISYAAGKGTTWSAPIAGSGGVVFAWFYCGTNQQAGITLSGDSTYTGDTFVNGSAFIGAKSDVLPHGARTGDVFVRGVLGFNGSSKGSDKIHPVVNGLYGDGTFKRATYNIDVDIGDNDADGDFDGIVADFNNVYKIGAGTQRFGGPVNCNMTFNVNAGTAVIDDALTVPTATVASGATIGGGGSISGDLDFAEGSFLAVSVANNAAPCLGVAGAVTGSAQVTVSAADRVRDGFSACILRSGSALPANFRCATKGYRLELREGGTELWLLKNPSATLIVVK